LKIRVSVVRIRPEAPFSLQLIIDHRVQKEP
jgi:hypothetical protein